jgi:8-oxo-dGTP diphosphatase
MKLTNLVFVVRRETGEVLLAMKKRGFGLGKLNGPGGKLGPGEDPALGASREVQEETQLVIPPGHLQERGVLDFFYAAKPAWNNSCTVFTATYQTSFGQPAETEEMAPRWVKISELDDVLPSMWEDDKIWLPQVLADAITGKVSDTLFKFSFDFEGDPPVLSKWVKAQ